MGGGGGPRQGAHETLCADAKMRQNLFPPRAVKRHPPNLTPFRVSGKFMNSHPPLITLKMISNHWVLLLRAEPVWFPYLRASTRTAAVVGLVHTSAHTLPFAIMTVLVHTTAHSSKLRPAGPSACRLGCVKSDTETPGLEPSEIFQSNSARYPGRFHKRRPA